MNNLRNKTTGFEFLAGFKEFFDKLLAIEQDED